MRNESDAGVWRTMSLLFGGLFAFFLVIVFLARGLVY